MLRPQHPRRNAIMAEQPDLAEMARELKVLQEERAILRMLYTYAHCIDYGRDEEFLDLFTEDTVRTVQRRDGAYLMKWLGRQALADSPHTRAPFNYHKH